MTVILHWQIGAARRIVIDFSSGFEHCDAKVTFGMPTGYTTAIGFGMIDQQYGEVRSVSPGASEFFCPESQRV
jgi:hypothetical protein